MHLTDHFGGPHTAVRGARLKKSQFLAKLNAASLLYSTASVKERPLARFVPVRKINMCFYFYMEQPMALSMAKPF